MERLLKMEHYLDNSATTRVCPEAAEAALRAMTEIYGNPSSTHTLGREAKKLLDLSRKQAAATLSMDEYRSEMEGIYTTCVVEDTIDESPMAYKPIDEIVSEIGPTAEIVERIRPVYNFKAAE